MPKRNGIPAALSPGEEAFALQCRVYNLTPEREYQFCERGWKFDFAWPAEKLALEIEGGTAFGKSRHSRGEGFEADCRKYNRAAREGWRVLRYTTAMVTAGTAIDEVRALIAATSCDVSSGPPCNQQSAAAIDTSASESISASECQRRD